MEITAKLPDQISSLGLLDLYNKKKDDTQIPYWEPSH